MNITIKTEITEDLIFKIKELARTKTITIYFDYRDKADDESLKNIFASGNEEELTNALYNYYDYISELNLDYQNELENDATGEIMKTLHIDDDLFCEVNDIARDYYNYDTNYEYLLKNTDITLYFEIFSNYDVLNSYWYSTQCGGYSYKETYLKTLLDFLSINPREFKKQAIARSIDVQGSFPDYKNRNNNEVIDIQSLLTELENTSSGCNCFVFFKEVTAFEAIDIYREFFNSKTITFEKNTSCGLFDSIQGGGSILECKIKNEHPIKIKNKYDCIGISTEHNQHYGVDCVYGMPSGWASCGGVSYG